MGHNLDLQKMLGVPDRDQCPRCKELVWTYFDDYDIDCGDPNPRRGFWRLTCYCASCDESWATEYTVKITKGEVYD